MRGFELLSRVARHASVELHVVSSAYDEDVANAPALAEAVGRVRVFRAEALAGSFLDRHRSTAFTAAVGALARGGRIDVLHVAGFSLMRHVPRDCRTPILLAEQSVEHALWEERARTCHDAAEHDEHLRRARLTREAATAAWRRATVVTAVTAEDRATIAECAPDIDVRLVPDGVDHLLPAATLPTTELEAKPTIVFVANFDEQQDVHKALRLCTEILTRVHRRCPTARIVVVGGEIEPLNAGDVVACPLPIGDGAKAKLVGSPVVTPSGHDLERFADEVAALLERQTERRELERRALECAQSLPTWDAAAGALLSCYEELGVVRSAA